MCYILIIGLSVLLGMALSFVIFEYKIDQLESELAKLRLANNKKLQEKLLEMMEEPAKAIPELQQLRNTNSPWDDEWDELLKGVSDTDSVAEYQEGCNIDNNEEKLNLPTIEEINDLAQKAWYHSLTGIPIKLEEKEDWKVQMRKDLKMYCPHVFVEFLLRRIQEIKNENINLH